MSFYNLESARLDAPCVPEGICHCCVCVFQMERSYLDSVKVTVADEPALIATFVNPRSCEGGEPADAGGDT